MEIFGSQIRPKKLWTEILVETPHPFKEVLTFHSEITEHNIILVLVLLSIEFSVMFLDNSMAKVSIPKWSVESSMSCYTNKIFSKSNLWRFYALFKMSSKNFYAIMKSMVFTCFSYSENSYICRTISFVSSILTNWFIDVNFIKNIMYTLLVIIFHKCSLLLFYQFSPSIPVFYNPCQCTFVRHENYELPSLGESISLVFQN